MKPLTDYQRFVLLTVSRCDGQQQAADDLGIALSTLKDTLLTVRRKLGVRTTAAALYLVLREKAA